MDKEQRRQAEYSKPYMALKSRPTAKDIPKILKIDKTIQHNYGKRYADAVAGKGMYTLSGVKESILSQARDNWKEAQILKKGGAEGVVKSQASADLKDAKRYVKEYGGLKKGSKEARKVLDDGDSSHGKLWRSHQRDLKEALKTIRQSDGQAKTSKVPKGLKGIADKMRDRGKSGWVTINGMHINLGG